MNVEKFKNLFIVIIHCILYFSFWIIFFIIGLLKWIFGFFEYISWWWIFAPIIFSASLFVIFFGILILIEFLSPIIDFKKNKDGDKDGF